MITSIRFRNFKTLRDTEIKLGAFNVIVGANGSGKSSVLQGLEALAEPYRIDFQKAISVGSKQNDLRIIVPLEKNGVLKNTGVAIHADGLRTYFFGDSNNEIHYNTGQAEESRKFEFKSLFERIKIFSLESSHLAQAVDPRSVTELQRDGKNLAGALTNLRDKDEESYDRLRAEFQRLIPEFDSIGFENDQNGYRQIKFRLKGSQQFIPATQASEGTLLALALLTIVYQPITPSLVGLEEPDRGLHPRLLRELRDALYRLSFPSDFGIKRQSVQVVVTTHSPFFLDLFKDHPEQVVIAEKQADGSTSFKNLGDDQELRGRIGDISLGEVWYSGILGGVPVPA